MAAMVGMHPVLSLVAVVAMAELAVHQIMGLVVLEATVVLVGQQAEVRTVALVVMGEQVVHQAMALVERGGALGMEAQVLEVELAVLEEQVELEGHQGMELEVKAELVEMRVLANRVPMEGLVAMAALRTQDQAGLVVMAEAEGQRLLPETRVDQVEMVAMEDHRDPGQVDPVGTVDQVVLDRMVEMGAQVDMVDLAAVVKELGEMAAMVHTITVKGAPAATGIPLATTARMTKA